MVTLADGKYNGDKSAAHQSVAGDMLCLLSAVIYGAYTVSIRCVRPQLAFSQAECWEGQFSRKSNAAPQGAKVQSGLTRRCGHWATVASCRVPTFSCAVVGLHPYPCLRFPR